MGLLDGVMGSVGGEGRRPGLGSTVAAGAILALLVKGIRNYQQAHPAPAEGRSFDPGQAAQPGAGGLGGLLGGLGGAGALGALVSQFQQRGLAAQVNSWIGRGPNEPVAPDQVAHALGEENVQALQQQTGAPREALLSELAQHLPDAVHELTPEGRLPDDAELHQIAQTQVRPG